MKRPKLYLTLVALAMLLLPPSAHGQMPTLRPAPKHPQLQRGQLQLRSPGAAVPQSPRRASHPQVYYKRPAGAFPGFLLMGTDDHDFVGGYDCSILQVAPYLNYTYEGMASGLMGQPWFSWEVDCINPANGNEELITIDGQQDISVSYKGKAFDVPVMTATDGEGLDSYDYQMLSNYSGTIYPAAVVPWPDFAQVYDGMELLKSSCDFSYSPNANENFYPFTLYGGMKPYGNNEAGYWFGKNAGYYGTLVDGIAQAFEKPEHPYLLKEVVLLAYGLKVTDRVDMKCKVYRIDKVPDYQDGTCVSLPEVPGELIAEGTARLGPINVEGDVSLIPFTLSVPRDDDLPWWVEGPVTIDDAIMVVIDGYNAPEMENLVNFSAFIGDETHVDDGYGERAYLKVGKADEEGNLVGQYQWRGLNNLFSQEEMKTGLTIFLTTDVPFITSNDPNDDYQHTFGAAGGVMEETTAGDGGDVTVRGVKLRSWLPSTSNDFTITCNGGELPQWLSIDPVDSYTADGQFNNLINAQVYALPLPEGVDYREAVVRFAIPGAYVDYKFMQARDGMVDPAAGYFLDVPDLDVEAGDTIVVPVRMCNVGDVVGFQTDIKLPEGVELLSGLDNFGVSLSDRASADHLLEVEQRPDSLIRVSSHSPTHTPFAGNMGDLFFLTMRIPRAASGKFPLQLRNTRFTLADLTAINVDAVTSAVLSVWPPANPMDVNRDGEISIADINNVVVIIINGGSSSSGHHRIPDVFAQNTTGDVNGDGEVSIADINTLINEILQGH